MPTQQEILQNHLPQIETWIDEYLPECPHQFPELKAHIEHFIIRLPLIGAFSAGKSTVLNALIGEKILSTKIKPETSIPTELSYNEKESVIVNSNQGIIEEIDFAKLKKQKSLEKYAQQGAWLEVGINAKHWQSFSHLCLVDFPGLDSSNKIHNLAIGQYLGKSLAYGIVISLADGVIVESTKKFLHALSTEEKPVIIILTKADQKAEKDRQAVIDKIISDIKEILKIDPFAVIVPPHNIEEPEETQRQLVEILTKIEEEQMPPVFRYHVGRPIISILNNLKENSLSVLIDKAKDEPEKIKSEIKKLTSDMKDFARETARSKEKFHNDVSNVCTYITEDIQGALDNKLRRFTELVLDGSNIDAPMEQEIKHQLKKSIHERYNPLVRNYIAGREKSIPADIRIQAPNLKHKSTSTASKSSAFGVDDLATSVGAVLPVLGRVIPAVGKFLGPVGMLVSTALPVFSKIIDYFFGEDEYEKRIRERDRAYEEISRKLTNQIIPDLAHNVGNEIESLLMSSINEIDQEFDSIIESQFQTKKQALEKLEQELAEKKEELQKKREKYEQDYQAVQNLVSLLENS